MLYLEFVNIYEKLSATSGRLEKIRVLAEFLKEIEKRGKAKWTYLLMGRVVPDYDSRELGISRQLAIKAISKADGIKESDVEKKFNKIGDLGEMAEEFAEKRRQRVLFSSKLNVEKVFDNLSKLMSMEGKGSVNKKMELISELLGNASGKEAKYIVRTLVSDLRIGVADGVLREALLEAFFSDEKDKMKEKIEEVYDLVNDFAVLFEAASRGKSAIEKMELHPGRPIKVMLPVKVTDIEEAFRICGKPLAVEHKYDGFRMLINNDDGKISLFTRKLENVTNQFPDVVKAVKEHVKGQSFILDSEVVGYDAKTKKSLPFQAISQRIKRKYDVEKLVKELPVEINVFDIVYHNGESVLAKPFVERRKILDRIVKEKENVIRLSKQFVSDDIKKIEKFYKDALASGEEGIMFKKLDAPYKQGRRVGYIVKLKPVANDLDLVIVGAEYGSGKRAGWLTSYIVACKSGDKFLDVGMVSSGLKEKEEEGTTYEEMTDILKPLIEKTEGTRAFVKPKIIVSVTYQNIQKSPSYSSGYALRFPRITAYRPDRSIRDIATLNDIEREAKKEER